MRARITTSSVHLAWTLSHDRNDIQCTELVVIRARMSDLGLANYALFSPYYAFEHCPKFSLLCLLKEPIMPHIDVIYNNKLCVCL